MNSLNEFINTDQNDCDKQFSKEVIKYQERVENILASLFIKEEELQNKPQETALHEASYNQVLEEYSDHEKFIAELCEFCHAIMKCKEIGQDMRDNWESLNDVDRDEIGIQMDAMMVCYEKLKILAADRLRNLQRIIENRQQSKIERLEEWLSAIEKKIAISNNIGPDYNAIQRQLKDMDDLKIELEQKQDFLNFISKVIIFDDVDLESLQIRSRSCRSIDERLESINHRWTKICSFVEERNIKLKSADSIWKLLNIEGPQLASWLARVERSLNELSEASRNVTDVQVEHAFVTKLNTRSDKIDLDIKSKQSFYTSLESRVRMEIDKLEVDDSCSMLVIELEKKLEEMQENWNTIMTRKRMLDYALQALVNPKLPETSCNMIPIPDSITSNPKNNFPFSSPFGVTLLERSDEDPPTDSNRIYSNVANDLSNNNDNDPNILNGSLSDFRAFDTSLSSNSQRAMPYGASPDHDQATCSKDDETPENLSSTSMTVSYPTNPISMDNSTYSPLRSIQMNHERNDDLNSLTTFPNSHSDCFNEHHESGNSSCRVEEWKHSLESFSTWLKQVETSLGIEDGSELIHNRFNRPWSRLDLTQQILLLKDIENQITSTCQDEFDCLLLQGQQIIEDLLPEIGVNEYEVNLKEILADIEVRYSTVKRSLSMRRQELANKDRWRDLLKNLRSSCDYLIAQMGEILPESNIGVDLITIAQQQDQLIHAKADLEDNAMLQANIQEAKLFLKVCDTLQQQYDQTHPSSNSMGDPLNRCMTKNDAIPTRTGTIDLLFSTFNDLREDVEGQLDRLTLHYSELSQLIEDRLTRLDEVHKEMHSIQHAMQDLATKLQVAEILKSNWIPLDNLSVERLSEQLEDLKLYRERLGDVDSTHTVMNSIFEWMTKSDVPLSQANLKRISELNTIWSLIQVSVEERQKLIEQAFDNQGASEQKFLTQTVADLPRWERRVAPTKIPYFVNHESNKTLWDHPRFTELLNEIASVKQYVFSAYRTALKLRMVQRKLGIDMIMLEQLKEIFETTEYKPRHQTQGESSSSNLPAQFSHIPNETLVSVENIIHYLKAIYERIQREEKSTLDVPLSIDLTLNWLLNLYDSTRTGYISSLSLKVGLALICCATREEKYVYMYRLIASQSTGCVDARKLGTLAETCMRIPIYLGEGESFGGPEIVEASVRDCFAMSKFNPDRPNSIDLGDFLNWLTTEPKFIIWLPVLHRLLISELTTHPVKCKLCNTKPITGLRYRCLRCLKFNICQECFLVGRHIYEHFDPAEHPMREYCSRTSSGENVRDFTKILRNKIVPKTSS